MKSWKAERLRRKEIFSRIKLRRQLSRDLDKWHDNLIKSYQQINLIWLVKTHLKGGEE